MAWVQQVNLTAVAPKGVGSGYPPRGIYKCITAPTEVGGTRNNADLLGIRFSHAVQVGYTPNEDGKGFTQDPSLVGEELRNHAKFPDGKSKGGDDARTAELKSALLSHGNGSRESLTNAQGLLNLESTSFDNKPCYVLFDPPAVGAGKEVYVELRYLSAEDFVAMLEGKRAVRWPQDGKAANKGSGQQTQRGIAASGLVPSRPAPAAPALSPAPAVAAPAPSAPSAAANVAAVMGGVPALPQGAPAGIATTQW